MKAEHSSESAYTGGQDHSQTKIAVVSSRWHAEVVEMMRQSAIETLKQYGVDESRIELVQVPGSFEIPLGVRWVAQRMDAVLCFGCVIKGETAHNEYINHSVCQSLQSLMLATGKPVLNGILTTDTLEQAHARASGSKGQKGRECAVAALEMVDVHKKLQAMERPTVGLRVDR